MKRRFDMELGTQTMLYLGFFVVLILASVVVAEGVAFLLLKTTGINIRIFSKNKGFVATFFSAVLLVMMLMIFSLLSGYFAVKW